jgi:hypothetical protein
VREGKGRERTSFSFIFPLPNPCTCIIIIIGRDGARKKEVPETIILIGIGYWLKIEI